MPQFSLANDDHLSALLTESGLDDLSFETNESVWSATFYNFLNMHELLKRDDTTGSELDRQRRQEYLSLLRRFEEGVQRIRRLKRIEMARTGNWKFQSYLTDSLEIVRYRVLLRVAYIGHLFGVTSASRLAQSAGMKIWGVLFFECGAA